MQVDYSGVLPYLLIRVSDTMQVRTDRTIYEIAAIKAKPSVEYTHTAVSLGRYSTLNQLSVALLSKTMLYHAPESEAAATMVVFVRSLFETERAIAHHFKVESLAALPPGYIEMRNRIDTAMQEHTRTREAALQKREEELARRAEELARREDAFLAQVLQDRAPAEEKPKRKRAPKKTT